MRRREFLMLIGGVEAARPLVARAQQSGIPVIGLHSGTHFNPMELENFKNGLRQAGYREGDNFRIEYRSAEGNYDRVPSLASDLVNRGVAVIVTIGGAASAPPAKAATTTIPVVFANGVIE